MADILPRVAGAHFAADEVTDDALVYLSQNLRQADQDEIHATVGHRRYLDAIRLSVAGADDAVVMVGVYGEPIAIIGVGTLSALYGIGSPWMLATPDAMRHPRAFISQGRAYTAAMMERYSGLMNHVDARNSASVAWLQRLGFKIAQPAPFGALGLPFHEFSLAR